MVRKLAAAAAALALGMGLAVSGAACQMGTIEVEMEAQGTAVVALYQVAAGSAECYQLPDILGGGIIRREDAQDPELAQWLADHMGEDGITRILDADGRGSFSNLEEGLYLLVQKQAPEGYACALPCLIPVPLDGQWEIWAMPKTARLLTQSPQTGDSFQPLLWAMGMILSGMGIWMCAEGIRKNREE